MDGKRDVWQTVKVIEEALDLLDHTGTATMTPTQTLDAMTAVRSLADRMSAEAAVWTDRAAKTCAAEKTAGTPLSDFLATTEGRSTAEANGLVHQASRITSDPVVRDAALAGKVSPGKAAAIGGVLRELPRHDMTPGQRTAAAATLVDQAAGGATTRQISGSADRVLEQVAPELVPGAGQKAAEAERRRRRAVKDRAFNFADTGEGSVRFWGQLPELEGDLLRNVIGACVERGRGDERRELENLKVQRASAGLTVGEYFAARTALQEREARSMKQRQADALTDMVTALQDVGQVPTAGGETPRVVVTLDYTTLLQYAVDTASTGIRPDGSLVDQASAARLRTALTGTFESGRDIPASQVRLACCDAGILPVVLGENSEILDVGHEHRLVTPPIRKALALRDKGCIFPGCTVPAAACQAHHVTPWWAGGTTSLDNLALVCRHHHGLVEPHRFDPAADQWTITFDQTTRRPVVHAPARLRHDLPPGHPDPGENSALGSELETVEPGEATRGSAGPEPDELDPGTGACQEDSAGLPKVEVPTQDALIA